MFSVIQAHNSSSLLALEAFSGDRFLVVERMRFSSDRSICSVSIPRCRWGSYIFPVGFLQVYFGIPLILYALFITHFDVSRPQGSAAALDGPGARYGYGVSRIWTLRVPGWCQSVQTLELALLWTVRLLWTVDSVQSLDFTARFRMGAELRLGGRVRLQPIHSCPSAYRCSDQFVANAVFQIYAFSSLQLPANARVAHYKCLIGFVRA